MKPKEQAEQLVEKYVVMSENFRVVTTWEYDKQCALIAVDEIIKNGFNPQMPYNYWQEVKQEIEKL